MKIWWDFGAGVIFLVSTRFLVALEVEWLNYRWHYKPGTAVLSNIRILVMSLFLLRTV